MTVRILLIDDNHTFLAAVKLFLGLELQAEVVGEAYDGYEALVKARELQPVLVLLDINLPAINGLDVARRILSWAHAPHIVFLSMHDDSAYREVANNLGASGFIGKADFGEQLLPMIGRIAARKAAPASRPLAQVPGMPQRVAPW